jgi:hypothetical protein
MRKISYAGYRFPPEVIEAAKAKGVYKGRPVTFDHERILALRKQGMGCTEIAKAVGCKRGNVYRSWRARAPPRPTSFHRRATGHSLQVTQGRPPAAFRASGPPPPHR